MDKLLEIKNLTVSIGGKRVIENVNLSFDAGEIVALVGESGSGKTLTGLSVLDLLPRIAVREQGEILYRGINIFDLGSEEKRKIRGGKISMVFQEPFTSLNPVMCIGSQISEGIRVHGSLSKKEIKKRIIELLRMVKLSQDVISRYPHELSGGMRQRVMLAMALASQVEIVIMDEPTTALDVSVQKEILDIVRSLQREKQFAILFITHDFSIVNMIADSVYVMKDGKVVETGTKEEVLHAPKDQYTKRLLDCIPKLGDKRRRFPG